MTEEVTPTTGTKATGGTQANLVDLAGAPSTSGASSTGTAAAGPRFGIFTLMLLMVVFCVMGSAGFYLMRSVQNGTSPRAVFVMFTLAAPGVLVIVMSMSRILLRWLARR